MQRLAAFPASAALLLYSDCEKVPGSREQVLFDALQASCSKHQSQVCAEAAKVQIQAYLLAGRKQHLAAGSCPELVYLLLYALPLDSKYIYDRLCRLL